MCESEELKFFTHRISLGRYSPCCYETLVKHISAMADNAGNILRSAFQKAIKGTFTVTLDCWTSG
jgi:hypothetical protein